MTDDLVQRVAIAISNEPARSGDKSIEDVARTLARAAIAVALEEVARVAEEVGPVVVRINPDRSKIINTWRAGEIAAAIRAMIPQEPA